MGRRALPGMEQTEGNAMKNDQTMRAGGRNIFDDLKLPEAEELNAKAQIAYRICGPSCTWMGCVEVGM